MREGSVLWNCHLSVKAHPIDRSIKRQSLSCVLSSDMSKLLAKATEHLQLMIWSITLSQLLHRELSMTSPNPLRSDLGHGFFCEPDHPKAFVGIRPDAVCSNAVPQQQKGHFDCVSTPYHSGKRVISIGCALCHTVALFD